MPNTSVCSLTTVLILSTLTSNLLISEIHFSMLFLSWTLGVEEELSRDGVSCGVFGCVWQ